jgi:hypothetical protein
VLFQWYAVLQFQMLTRPTQRMVLSNTAWSVAEQVGQLLAWLQAEGAVHYDCKLPNLALLVSNADFYPLLPSCAPVCRCTCQRQQQPVCGS